MLRCHVCGEEFGGEPVWTRCRMLCPACAEKPRVRYYYLNRPPSIGCQPDGFVDRETWMPSREIPNGDGWWALGWVEYIEPLDPEQIWRYELRPADQEELARYWTWREAR